MKPTYFTCTLGEAKLWKERNPDAPRFKDVIDLIDQQASRIPNSPAAGFALFQVLKQEQPRYLTFAELARQSINASLILKAQVGRRESEETPETVGLLCSSSFEFLLVFLGLLRLGYSVLFLAPQLEPKAIEHLCATLGVETIYTDDRQESRLTTVKDSIRVRKVPSHHELEDSSADETNGISTRLGLPEVAYWCHTSGTSSGLPKPIPQTHAGVVAALPSFDDDTSATYTTTPLYHGGIVDGYRAWTSGAMIWYFPEGTAPITSDSVTKSVQSAQGTKAGNVKYFSSVPYILQLLADDTEGLAMIQSLDLVGVGGAALPESVGNRLVEQGVHLLSRMGSAECGFLMSSHRDYSTDKNWQYLRPVQDERLMAFERQSDGLSELIVKAGWPFLAKTNRPDGAFATSDLFEPLNGDKDCGIWRYHSRSDAQITLSNGKKFDPAPMEAALVASSDLIKDVLIFGAGKGYPGALLVPRPGISCEGFIDQVWPPVQAINQGSQNHSRLSKSMLVIIDPEVENAVFEKSSKGTLLRRTVEQRFAGRISNAYENSTSRPKLPDSATHEDLRRAVWECFDDVLGREVKPDTDLFLQGVDSLSCMQIRGMIQASCLPTDGPSLLPLNVVYDQSTLEGLVGYVWHLRQGKSAPDHKAVEEGQLRAMKQMSEELVIGNQSTPDTVQVPDQKEKKSVVLTGATGFLGGWILKHLVDDKSVSTVCCLVRAPDELTARDRVHRSLKNRGLAEALDDKVQCLPCDLAEQDCGLSSKQRDTLLAQATLVIHSAWAVNFNLSLPSFRDQVIGTSNLLRLSLKAKARFVFISSTAAASNKGTSPVTETVSTDPSDASPLGYSRSKWVAEQICAAAAKSAAAAEPRDRGRSLVTIIRVGQLCGDLNGVWNASEAYPLMLSTARLINCLPDIADEPTNWVPVHHAARAVLDIADSTRADDGGDGGLLLVYHVANPHGTPDWEQMLDWILEAEASSTTTASFEKVAPADWVARLEEASREPGASHPSFALLELWKTAYGSVSDDKSTSSPGLTFDISRSMRVSSTMEALQPLSREELLRMWQWARNAIQ